MSSCQVTLTPAVNGTGCLVKLSGTIDDSFDGTPMIDASQGVLAIDLGQVTRITSFGLHKWVDTIRRVTERAVYVGLVNCRPAIVTQLNTVAGFAASAEVVSFFAPLRCQSCQAELQQLLDLRRDHEAVRVRLLPPVRCAKCDTVASLDENADSYLAALAAASVPSPPPLFEQLLGGAATTTAKTLRVRKEVRGNVTLVRFSGALEQPSRFQRLADGLEGDVALLFGEVERVTAAGVTALVNWLQTAPPSTWLFQLGDELTCALGEQPDVPRNLCSAALAHHCPQCGGESVEEFNRSQLRGLQTGTLPPRSCVCGGQLEERFTPQALRRAAGLVTADPPGEVSRCLSSAASPPEPEGPVEFGRYQLVQSFGRAGTTETFLGRKVGIGGFTKEVIIKRLLPQFAANGTQVKSFLDAVRFATELHHPNVTQLLDFGQVDGQYFVAIEQFGQWTLETVLQVCARQRVTLPAPLAALIVREVLSALHAAHSHQSETGAAEPLVHGHLVPGNILISPNGSLKVTDFGLGKLAKPSNQADPASDLRAVGELLRKLLEVANDSKALRLIAESAVSQTDARLLTALDFQQALDALLHQGERVDFGGWLKATMAGAATSVTPTPRGLTPVPQRGPTILLIHGARKRLDEVVAPLREAFHQLEECTNVDQMPALAYQVVIADYDGLSPADRHRLIQRFPAPTSASTVVLVSEGECRKDFVELFEKRTLHHLVGRNGKLNPANLILLIKKLTTTDIFGVEKYLGAHADVLTLSVLRSTDKANVLTQIEESLRHRFLNPRLVNVLVSAADELVTNAVYNAPLNDRGATRFRSLSRSEEVVLSRGEHVEIKLCRDDEGFALSVVDSFGSLPPERVFEYLARGFRKGEDQVSRADGGAGIGLYLLLQSLTHLVVNIHPNRRTEIIGLLAHTDTYRDLSLLNKSFDIFSLPART